MKKKLFCVFLISLLLLCLASCAEKADNNEKDNAEENLVANNVVDNYNPDEPITIFLPDKRIINNYYLDLENNKIIFNVSDSIEFVLNDPTYVNIAIESGDTLEINISRNIGERTFEIIGTLTQPISNANVDKIEVDYTFSAPLDSVSIGVMVDSKSNR